jgi:signal peptidase
MPMREKNVVRILFLIFVGITVGVNFYAWNAGNLVGDHLPMPFGYGASVVLSGSMEPVLSAGDLVIIKETKNVDVGDVIVYQSSDNELIIHRIISRDNDTIVTQGDANNAADVPITIDAVKGKMTRHVPKLGMLVRLLKQPAVVIALLILAFFLMEQSFQRDKAKGDEDIEAIKAEIRRLQDTQNKVRESS